MPKTKLQNLYLFFEETEYGKDISSNLLRIAMNRFIIDEDAQKNFQM